MASMNETRIILRADDRTAGAFKSVQGSINSLKGAAAGLGVALSASAFVGFIKSSIDMADSLNDLSKTTGASVETLAGLQLAAKQSGTELETVAKGMLKFSGVVLDASNGSKEAADKIAALGLNLKTLKAQSPEQQFIALAGALEKFGADKQGVIVADVLGQKMATLTPLLSEGADGLREMLEQGKKLNPITAEMAKQADIFNDRLAVFKAQAGSVGIVMANNLLPVLNDMAAEFGKTGDKAAQSVPSFNILAETLRATVVFGGNVAFVLKGIGVEIGGMAAQLNALAHGDFTAFSSIGIMMKEDAKSARQEFDAWEARMMAAGTKLTAATQAGSTKPPSAEYKITDTKHAKELADLTLKQRKAMAEGDQWAADSLSDQIAEANKEQAKWRDTARDTARGFIDMVSPVDELVRKIQAAEFLMSEGFLNKDQGEAVLFDLNVQIEQLNEVKDATKEVDDFARDMGLTFTSAFEDAAIKGEGLRDVVNALGKDLARVVWRKTVTEPLGNAVSGAVKSSGIGDFFGNFFGGGRASGGPVNPGQFYVVGEKGPEILMPKTAGTVIPNGASTGGGIVINQNYTIDARGADAGVEAKIIRAMQAVKQDTIATIQQSLLRGGAMATAAGKR
jgi:hypothetical protein